MGFQCCIFGKTRKEALESLRQWYSITIACSARPQPSGKPNDAISDEEGRLLELLSILIDEYEDRTHPLPKAEPHKMLAYLLGERY